MRVKDGVLDFEQSISSLFANEKYGDNSLGSLLFYYKSGQLTLYFSMAEA